MVLVFVVEILAKVLSNGSRLVLVLVMVVVLVVVPAVVPVLVQVVAAAVVLVVAMPSSLILFL